MDTLYTKWARLLTHYCLTIQPGEKVLINSTWLAEPLLQEVYKEILLAGGIPQLQVGIADQERLLLTFGNEQQLSYVNPLTKVAMETYDAYLVIRAPFNLKETQDVPTAQRDIRQRATLSINQTYFERTGNGSMKRCLTEYPTQAQAQEAGLSLTAFSEFVWKACHLHTDNPVDAWLQVRSRQQAYVDYLNTREQIRYVGDGTDITFSTRGRTWINSDGKANMPSGEVFTSPVEESGNGHVRFTYPAIFMGHEVENVRLQLEQGQVVDWQADRGKDFLDYFFSIEGARHVGEIAIGSNYGIDRFSKNILFDEKIGGTIHMAFGQSYPQAGGRNKSTVHWDMIADMRQGGAIYADGEKFYENGQFLIG